MLFIRAAKFAMDEGSSDGNFFPWFESKAGGTNRFCICWFLDAEKEDRGRDGKKSETGFVKGELCWRSFAWVRLFNISQEVPFSAISQHTNTCANRKNRVRR